MLSNNKMIIYVPSPSELRRPRNYQEVMLETYTIARTKPSLIKYLGMPSTIFSAVVPKRGSKPKKPSGDEALINHVSQIKRKRKLNMMETGRAPYGQKLRAKYATAEARRVGSLAKRRATLSKMKKLQAKTKDFENRSSAIKKAFKLVQLKKQKYKLEHQKAIVKKRVLNPKFKIIMDTNFVMSKPIHNPMQIINSTRLEVYRSWSMRKPNESFKVNITLQIQYSHLEKDKNGNSYSKKGIFFDIMKDVINSESDINRLIRELYMRFFKVDENNVSTQPDSDWEFDNYFGFRVAITRYVVRTAKVYIELSEKHRNPKKGLINIRNEDDT